MNKFKAGDRVRCGNREGIVSEINLDDGRYGSVGVRWDDYHYRTHDDRHTILQDSLEPVCTKAEPVFKVGDRVRVNDPMQGAWHNRTGVITQADGLSGYKHKVSVVKFDDNKSESTYYDKDLELLSPPSPQPQTTEPKEDTVMFQVSMYDPVSGLVSNATYSTEEQAKSSAEITINERRSKKQAFTATIVNIKTGKLVGTVVDAPPAVDWKTE